MFKLQPFPRRSLTALISVLVLLVAFCNGQQNASGGLSSPKEPASNPQATSAPVIQIYNTGADPFFQGKISEYVRRIFQDKTGTLWFGVSGGLYRFDPVAERFIYITRSGPWQ